MSGSVPSGDPSSALVIDGHDRRRRPVSNCTTRCAGRTGQLHRGDRFRRQPGRCRAGPAVVPAADAHLLAELLQGGRPAPDRDRFPHPRFREALSERTLIEGGLGEFAYRNQLPGALTPRDRRPGRDRRAPTPVTVGIRRRPRWYPSAAVRIRWSASRRSAVTALRRCCSASTGMTRIDRCIEVSGLQQCARPAQHRPPRLIQANADGAYNGHVPVTAINSVIGLIVADTNRVRAGGAVQRARPPTSATSSGSAAISTTSGPRVWRTRRCYGTPWRSYGFNPDRYFCCCAGCRNRRSPTGSPPAENISASSPAATGCSRWIRAGAPVPGAGTARNASSSSCCWPRGWAGATLEKIFGAQPVRRHRESGRVSPTSSGSACTSRSNAWGSTTRPPSPCSR